MDGSISVSWWSGSSVFSEVAFFVLIWQFGEAKGSTPCVDAILIIRRGTQSFPDRIIFNIIMQFLHLGFWGFCLTGS